MGKSLDGADAANDFGGIGGGVGQGVLGKARASAHPAAKADNRQDDERNGQQNQAGQPRTGDHHHDGGADKQHQIAQREGGAGADGGFDLGRVGGQPGDDLAGARRVKERRRQVHEMAEQIAAQIGDDALAKRDHQVIPAGAGRRQKGGQENQHGEIVVDEGGILAGEAEIDHAANGERQGQGHQGRGNQRGKGGNHAAAIAHQIWPQSGKRAQRAPRRPAVIGAERLGYAVLGAVMIAHDWRRSEHVRRGFARGCGDPDNVLMGRGRRLEGCRANLYRGAEDRNPVMPEAA